MWRQREFIQPFFQGNGKVFKDTRANIYIIAFYGALWGRNT